MSPEEEKRDAVVALVAGLLAMILLWSGFGHGPPGSRFSEGQVLFVVAILASVTSMFFAVRVWRSPAQDSGNTAMSVIGFVVAILALLSAAGTWLMWWWMRMVWG